MPATPTLTLTDNRLTVSALARELDKGEHPMNRSAILRFEANPDVPHILGKQGDLYPPESLQWWRKIAEARAHKPALVEPATAGIWLRELMNDPVKLRRVEAELSDDRTADNGPEGENALALPAVANQRALLAVFETAIERASERGVVAGMKQAAASVLPPRNNRVLTLKEAREETGLSESTIKRLPFVQETGAGGRRKWKWSVLQDAIDAL